MGKRAMAITRVGCAVLAQGGSSRLARPEALPTLRGGTLLRDAVEQARSSTCDRIAVVLGGPAEDAARALDGRDVELLANETWREGIGSSIRRATAWAMDSSCDALVVILAGDPNPDASHLDRLVAEGRAGALAVASVCAGAIGMPALFTSTFFAALLRLGGDGGAASLLRGERGTAPYAAAGVSVVPWPEGERARVRAIDADDEAGVGHGRRYEGEASRSLRIFSGPVRPRRRPRSPAPTD